MDRMPHGSWYKPTARTREIEEDAAAQYDWDSKINKMYQDRTA